MKTPWMKCHKMPNVTSVTMWWERNQIKKTILFIRFYYDSFDVVVAVAGLTFFGTIWWKFICERDKLSWNSNIKIILCASCALVACHVCKSICHEPNWNQKSTVRVNITIMHKCIHVRHTAIWRNLIYPFLMFYPKDVGQAAFVITRDLAIEELFWNDFYFFLNEIPKYEILR